MARHRLLVRRIFIGALLGSLLLCNACSPGITEHITGDHFSYTIKKSWVHEVVFGQDWYFFNEGNADTQNRPAVYVPAVMQTEGTYCTLEAQIDYLSGLYSDLDSHAVLLTEEAGIIGGFASYTAEAKVNTSGESVEFKVLEKVFFVSPNEVAQVSYLAPEDIFDAYKPEATELFDSITINGSRGILFRFL